jgi:large subunit ribosomal protein L18
MADKFKTRLRLAERRRKRVRSKINGTLEKPRLTVCKTLKHVYAQIVDDSQGQTLAFAGTLSKSVADKVSKAKNKTDRAKVVGLAIAELAKEKGITKVVFDRNSNLYHGRVRAVAEAAREGGLEF